MTGGAAAPPALSPVQVQLQRVQGLAERADWAAIEAKELPACTGADAACAEAQALRARACRSLANAPGVETGRRAALRDCAVSAGQAALAAGADAPASKRAEWRENLAWSLFERRQETSRAQICPDNDLLRTEADSLRQERPDLASARFLAASARLTGSAESCVPAEQRCEDLAVASRLLTPVPPGDERWRAVAEGVEMQRRIALGCPGTT